MTITDLVEKLHYTPDRISKDTMISEGVIKNILAGKANVNRLLAMRLSKVYGGSVQDWMR